MSSIMTFKRLCISLALLRLCAVADVSRSLGKSPDNRFELVLSASSNKDLGMVLIRDLKSGQTTPTDTWQGYGSFETEDIEATWRKTSDAFAVTVRGTKRTWNTDVYVLDDKAWEKLDFPPYVANILGRQGVFRGGRTLHEGFGGFLEKDQFVLFSYVEPDWQQKEKTAQIKDWKPTTQTEWKVTLEFYRRVSPNCTIVDIEPVPDSSKNSDK